ncbi:MAG: gliding motility-associated C-terminal domain-containing protein [Bacteroidetes bacterium]|nr:gliding motility-associated C-terminal domain-containing protein [Bacteroidota bacterium]
MKTSTLKFFLPFILLPAIIFANQNTGKQKWTSNAFDQKVFVENKGQFADDVLFSANSGGVNIFFSKNGLKYEYTEVKKLSEEEREKAERGENISEKSKPTIHHLGIEWLGANENTEVKSEEEVPFYYTYGSAYPETKTITAHAFRKIIYKNLYPNIDVEYIFPKDSSGIKYSIILHPGADASIIKMKYSGAKNISIDEKGNSVIKTSMGKFIDYAPVSYYEGGELVASNFILENNIIAFELNLKSQISNLKSIVIDPWTTNPNFPGTNKAYDVNYDLNGNVYAYGSYGPFQLTKFNSAGAIQWIFHCPNNFGWSITGNAYGDFAVDEVSGTSYIAEGFHVLAGATVLKINSAGTQSASYTVGNTMNEVWRAEYNRCIGKIVLAGGGTLANYQSAVIDTNFTTITPVNVLSASSAYNDMALLGVDNNSNFCYMLCAGSGWSSPYDNKLYKCPIPNLLPLSFSVSTSHTFQEAGIAYTMTNGFNGLAVSPSYVFTYDGSDLKRWDKNTGASVSVTNITATKFQWGGLAVDECDNIYVGAQSSIKVYNSALTLVNTYTLTNTVFDLKLGPNNKLYACGNGFVTEINLPASNMSINVSATPATGCTACNGSATVSATSCGNASNFSYQWFPGGQTTQTATGLCAGTYSVVLSTNCNTSFTYTTSVTNSGGGNISVNANNVSCNGGNNGNATASVSGGNPPYTFQWSSGASTSSATGLSAGNYTVTVTDAGGCSSTQTISITQPTAIVPVASSQNVSCNGGNNGSATVSVSGGNSSYSYLWNNGQTTSSANNLSAGNYSVVVTDANGCTSSAAINISQPSALSVSASSTGNTSCISPNGSATANASGGTSTYIYVWSNGQTSQTANNLSSGNYSVTVTDANGCTATQTVSVAGPTPPTISVSGNTILCQGDQTILTASGGVVYSWSNGSTGAAVAVAPAVTTTYTVIGTDANGCTNTSTISVTVSPPPIANISGNTTICQGDFANLSASGGGNYLWSTGANTQNISVTSAGNYSVVVSVGSCSDTASVNVFVNPLPTANAGTDATIDMGQSTLLSASGGNSYSWIPPTNLSCSNCANPNASPPSTTTYTVFVTDVNGCSSSDEVTVFVKEPDCTDNLFIPNAFSPNGDGENDILHMHYNPYCVEKAQLRIFNRWGEKVFETTDITQGWDGTFGGERLNTSVFVYFFDATIINGSKISRKGNISLIR